MNVFDYLAYLQYHTRVGGLEPKDYIAVGFVITVFWYLFATNIKKNNTPKDTSMKTLLFAWVGASAGFFFLTELNKGLFTARIKKYKKEGYEDDDARDHAMMDARGGRHHSLF